MMAQPKLLTLLEIAEICHAANRVYCRHAKSYSQLRWDRLDRAKQEGIAEGVSFVIDNPDCTPQETHAAWVKSTLKLGWIHGGVLDGTAKCHPSLVPWDELPVREQIKDELFLGIVRACLAPLRETLASSIPAQSEETPAPEGE